MGPHAGRGVLRAGGVMAWAAADTAHAITSASPRMTESTPSDAHLAHALDRFGRDAEPGSGGRERFTARSPQFGNQPQCLVFAPGSHPRPCMQSTQDAVVTMMSAAWVSVTVPSDTHICAWYVANGTVADPWTRVNPLIVTEPSSGSR